MARQDTDLPFGDAFSPTQLETEDNTEELALVLQLIKEHEGRPNHFDQAIQETFFPDDDGTRAKNVRLGVGPNGYQLTTDKFELTEIGQELYELRDTPEELYDQFARYILRELHGLKGIEIIEDLRAQGKSTTNENLKEEFRKQYNFHIDGTSNHWSQMRAWMSKAGVVNAGVHQYDIDRKRIQDLIGADSGLILTLDGLTAEQQAFLRALALLNPEDWIQNVKVREIAEEAYGVDITQSSIKTHMLDPLEDAGFIEWEHVSGKPNLIRVTGKFDADVLTPILEDLATRTGAPRSVLRKSHSELLEEMDEDNTHQRGVALEALTIKLGRLLGLEFAGWQVRGQKTGGAEVDVVFDDVGTFFNRVQIQCKNTQRQLTMKQVAREVGVARMLQTNTILMIARGGVSTDAQQYADRIMQHENIAIAFVKGDDIEQLDQNPTHLIEALEAETARTHGIKQLNVGDGAKEQEKPIEEREERALDEFADKLNEETDDTAEYRLTDFTDEE